MQQADAPAPMPPAFHHLRRQRHRHQFTPCIKARGQSLQQFIVAHHGNAGLAGDDADRHRRQFRRGHDAQPRREGRRQHRDHRIAGTCRVVLVACLGAQLQHFRFPAHGAMHQGQPFRAARHQNGTEGHFALERQRRGGQFGGGAHWQPGRQRQLLGVGHDQVGAGEAGQRAAAGVHHHAAAGGPRGGDDARRHIARQHALLVVAQHDHGGRRDRVGGDPHQPVGQAGVDRAGLFMIGAHDVLAAGDEAGLGRRRPAALHQQPWLDPQLAADQAGQFAARLVVAHHRDEGDSGPQRRQVAHHIAGAAGQSQLALHRQHRHRRLRTDATDPAIDVAIEHRIAHHQQRAASQQAHRGGQRDGWPVRGGNNFLGHLFFLCSQPGCLRHGGPQAAKIANHDRMAKARSAAGTRRLSEGPVNLPGAGWRTMPLNSTP